MGLPWLVADVDFTGNGDDSWGFVMLEIELKIKKRRVLMEWSRNG